MSQPKVLVLAGRGLNCEIETLHAFSLVGIEGQIRHVDDVLAPGFDLNAFNVLAVPGGFSFGDHTGAGKALANLLRDRLAERFLAFMDQPDRLAIGICNGCQALVKSGLWDRQAETDSGQVSVASNAGGDYICKWVQVSNQAPDSPWLNQVPGQLALPIAHGEGRFVATAELSPALAYEGENPNGSQQETAAVTGFDGRLIAMMPHPERALRFTQQPDWTAKRERLRRAGEALPADGPGLSIFRSAARWLG